MTNRTELKHTRNGGFTMGRYLNPDNTEFEESVNSEIYIDKSMLIEYTNKVLRTQQKYICVSRPRRFGKSMAANMLTAYYSKDCDSKELFSNLKISESENFEKHLNKYNVIRINMQNFLNKAKSIEQMINLVSLTVGRDIFRKYPDVDYLDKSVLSYVLDDVFEEYKIPFIIIIDEWDCVLRDNRIGDDEQKQYLDFLCDIYKDQRYLALGYMTGILPIKKYGKHSAINVFYEYSMTNAAPISEFTGFTETEVMNICEKYDKSFSEMKRWYDGYRVNDNHIYNPKSVVEAVIR